MKKNRKQKDIIVPSCADLVIPITLVLGAYIILHGHLSPGGGFQGGVLLTGAIAIFFIAYGRDKVLKTFHLENDKVVLALDEANGNVELAGRNLPNVLVGQYNHISVYQMMNAKHLVITKTAVEKFEEVLK